MRGPELESITPTPAESELARTSGRKLSQRADGDLTIDVPGVGPVELPGAAVKLLHQILAQMAEGHAVTILPRAAQLTTQQAADLLGVSRPFLVKQIELRKLRYRRVGTHRRITVKDLMDYKRRTDARRIKALEDLAAEAHAPQ